jgi:DNA-binding beta-propeller fold protein YncE
MHVKGHPFILVMITLLLAACAIPPTESVRQEVEVANVYLYLQPLPQEAQKLTFEISALSARRLGGEPVALLGKPLPLIPAERVGRQTRLLAVHLPPGEYAGLEMGIGTVEMSTDTGAVELLVDDAPLWLEKRFVVAPDKAEILYLALEPERLVTDGYRFTPRFSLWQPPPPLPNLKGVVSHPETGQLSVIEKNNAWLTTIVPVGREPHGLALDQRLLRIYVALAGDDAVAAIDLVQERVEQFVRMRGGDRPTDLVLSSDGQTLVTLNQGNHSISIIDAATLLERERIRFPTRPGMVVTGAEARTAYVLLPEASALSVVDLDRASVIATATLPDAPVDAVLDPDSNQLFLISRDAPDLLVVDAETLVIEQRIFVGQGARCLAIGAGRGLVYVGLDNGQIQVVSARAGLPIDRFRTGPAVAGLFIDIEENALYVLPENEARLEKYDLVGKKQLAIIDLPAAGDMMTVMGE